MRNEDGTDSEEHTFVPAARCNEIYKDNLTMSSDYYNSVMAIEFLLDDWICPNVTSFTLSENPWMLKIIGGVNFVSVVNDCKTAEIVD